MLYNAYEFQRSLMSAASAWADFQGQWLRNPLNPLSYNNVAPIMASGLDVFAHASASRGKPAFGFTDVEVNGERVAVTEEIVLRKPFGDLKRFRRAGVSGQTSVLIVAPMSGHFATLLRGTVERLTGKHDVYITDWHDAKMVPIDGGRFDLDDYIDYLIEFLEAIGPGTHMLAVCQPSVPAFAATALMSADGNSCRPVTLTMMGGPIDTREAPTAVNTVATQRPLAWFGQNVIHTVPSFYPGAGRKVYPGFLQLSGFMAMNLGNHLASHWGMFKHLVEGDEESADATKAFYSEYRSVCDLTEEFYLQTVDTVFQRHLLPKGEFLHRGRLIDPAAITDVGLLAIEGEHDDISGLGQTRAALTLVPALPETHRKYVMAEKVGHYGIFNGRRWREQIAPVVEDWIVKHAR